ncbi:hypothetical protein MNBD_GAMMA01-1078 [hydrothermal vent metagenome]|uniref:Uncharacterized protein n=1 Tax=hydrothermal vent metagenome TaxID=652676 RepID=A0A3B0UZB9_9ZZZZ
MIKTTCLLLINLFTASLVIAEPTIYLVRHAEKITTQDITDPELTAIGHFRAQNIAKQLSAAGITQIFSTNYKRTMQTAKPLADMLAIDIQYYNPDKLAEFANKLQTMNAVILIVGHSNTTPELTALLSKQKIAKINKNEYDNLYQVIIHSEWIRLNRFKTIP